VPHCSLRFYCFLLVGKDVAREPAQPFAVRLSVQSETNTVAAVILRPVPPKALN